MDSNHNILVLRTLVTETFPHDPDKTNTIKKKKHNKGKKTYVTTRMLHICHCYSAASKALTLIERSARAPLLDASLLFTVGSYDLRLINMSS